MSPSATADARTDSVRQAMDEWPAMPVETEIYLLPDGRVVIADLPIELTDLLAKLGTVETLGSDVEAISDQPARG